MKHIKNFEGFLNETIVDGHYQAHTRGENYGRKTSIFTLKVPEWQYFNIANTHPEYGPLAKEWHDALKELGIKEEEAGVVFESFMPAHRNNFHADVNFIMKQADSCNLDYLEVEDTENGDNGIIFSVKQ